MLDKMPMHWILSFCQFLLLFCLCVIDTKPDKSETMLIYTTFVRVECSQFVHTFGRFLCRAAGEKRTLSVLCSLLSKERNTNFTLNLIDHESNTKCRIIVNRLSHAVTSSHQCDSCDSFHSHKIRSFISRKGRNHSIRTSLQDVHFIVRAVCFRFANAINRTRKNVHYRKKKRIFFVSIFEQTNKTELVQEGSIGRSSGRKPNKKLPKIINARVTRCHLARHSVKRH